MKGFEVEELRRKLKPSEGEQEGVFLAKEERSTLPDVKWMAVAKVLTSKSFSAESLKQTLFAAWNTAREVSFTSIEKKLFVLQCGDPAYHCMV
ncbi:hypothetical protein QYE76_012994 [Lolium multiflorum]|uniref:Uncharacterized protein n=1 Tax=Lolium multiflorum TaxID=4521 RepID=A0AAD8U226_LOLMU|nr:hypothetical protein QYE76_012994 [Lolium multiflorum]